MKKRVIRRRQFLRGAGGAALGLPFLPSIVPGRAWGQSVSFDPGPRFVAICTNHGGIGEDAMFPAPTSAVEGMQLYPGMQVHRGDLARTVRGDRASISEVLTGPANVLTEPLVAKMNVLWGLDIPFYIAHHTGGHLGNYARNDGNGEAGQSVQMQHMPTIDQLMAWSPTFYPELAGVTARSLHGGSGRFSWGYSNPSSASGAIQEVRSDFDGPSYFDQAFPGGLPERSEADQPARPSIVDRVIDSYRSLRQSDRRLSPDDRQRLDDHMDRLAELQRRLSTVSTCRDVSPPQHRAGSAKNYDDLVDVTAAAFACGASRIAVLGVHERDYVEFGGDWHQDVAHQHMLDGPQGMLLEANQKAFERVVLALASRLDALEEAPGKSVLDSTLLTWSQESGVITHEARSVPVITFGSAGGFLRTGQLCDFRNLGERGRLRDEDPIVRHSGLLYNQWLATCLQAMGLPPSEWQDTPHNGPSGYGLPSIDDDYAQSHVGGVVENASDVLPFLRG